MLCFCHVLRMLLFLVSIIMQDWSQSLNTYGERYRRVSKCFSVIFCRKCVYDVISFLGFLIIIILQTSWLIWRHWVYKMLVYSVKCVCLQLSQFPQLSFYVIYGAVCLRLIHLSCDDFQNMCTSSCHHHKFGTTVKPVHNDHLMGHFSAFCSSWWPRAT